MELNTLYLDFKDSVCNILTHEASRKIQKLYQSGRLEILCKSDIKEEGLTSVWIVKNHKEYTIEINNSVLKTPYGCYRQAVLIHEIAHLLNYNMEKYDSKKKIAEVDKHGAEWRQILRENVRSRNIINEAINETGLSIPRCIFKKKERCLWCKKKPRESGSILRFSSCDGNYYDSLLRL